MPSPAAPAPEVLANPSAEEAALIRRIEEELKPESALGGVLARRVGVHSARLERSWRQESAALDERFDEARLAEVDHLTSDIAVEPATKVRALRSSPEGVDRMLDRWRALRAELQHSVEERWTFRHQHSAENLMGRRPEDLPLSRIQALSQALWNNEKYLEPAEREGRDSKAIRAFAKLELDSIIADQINDLEAHRATLDLHRIALDRPGAADRALHDPSPAAALARKQEAAAERGLYRALKEFRQVQADHRAAFAAAPAPKPPAPPAEPPRPAALGSFRQVESPAPAPVPAMTYVPVVRAGEGPMSIGGGLR